MIKLNALREGRLSVGQKCIEAEEACFSNNLTDPQPFNRYE